MKSKGLLASLGAVGAAVAASACCIGPVLLGGLGLGGAALGAALEPWRPWLLGITAVLLGVAFYRVYRVQPQACVDGTCETPRSRRGARLAVWLAAVLASTAGAYPYLVTSAEADPPDPAPGAETMTLTIRGMTCQACTGHVRTALEAVPGVLSATVEHPAGKAVVTLAEPKPDAADLVRAVRKAGYEARVDGAAAEPEPVELTPLGDSIAPLTKAFNAAAGRVRLVLLMSPS